MASDLLTYSTELRAGFRSWNPIQRAEALAAGQRLKLSNYTLADMVRVSEVTVRNLVSLLLLPAADKAAIAAGAPYRSFLKKVRNIKVKAEADAAEKLASDRKKAAKRGCEAIRSFFSQTIELAEAYAEQILEETRAFIRGGEEEGILRPSDVLWAGNPAPVITATKPAAFENLSGIELINATVRWSCNWIVRVMPNSDVREAAIAQALAEPRLLVM